MTDERGSGGVASHEFECAVLPYLKPLARFARFLMRGNRADAEDLVQEAVLRAFEAFPRFQRGTWLFRILRNTYVDRLRRQGRESQLIDQDAEAPGSDASVEEFQSQARRECSAADLEAALGEVPAELRIVLLVDGEGMRRNGIRGRADRIAESQSLTFRNSRSHLSFSHLLRRLRTSGSPLEAARDTI